MAYYDTMRSFYRQELGVRLACHVKCGGYTEIHAVGPYPDYAHVFDDAAFEGPNHARELRNALRRRARAALAYGKGEE